MIYTNIVRTTQPMKNLKINRDFDFFKQYQPQKFRYPRDEAELKKIKQFKMQIVIAGEMVEGGKRSNENLISRSLLFLDLDDVKDNETDFITKLTTKLKDVNYCLYPTIQHKTNEYIRYRLVMELSRNVMPEEYKLLVFGLYHELGINYEFDTSNDTWSQGQGLPVVTELSKNSPIIFHDEGQAIPVNLFLKEIKKSKEYRTTQKSSSYSYRKHSGKKLYTGEFLDMLVNGAEMGNRNNWFKTMIDKMLAVGAELNTIYNLILVVNDNFISNPLPISEINVIFKSRVKNHTSKEV